MTQTKKSPEKPGRFIESISNVHESVRNLISESVTTNRELIENGRRQYAKHEEKLLGLSACEWSNGEIVSSTPLLLDWDDVRVKLQQRNRKLINLSKRFVSNSIANEYNQHTAIAATSQTEVEKTTMLSHGGCS